MYDIITSSMTSFHMHCCCCPFKRMRNVPGTFWNVPWKLPVKASVDRSGKTPDQSETHGTEPTDGSVVLSGKFREFSIDSEILTKFLEAKVPYTFPT